VGHGIVEGIQQAISWRRNYIFVNIAATEIIPAPITCAHCASPAIVLHQEKDTRKHPTPLCADHLPKLTQRLKDWLRMKITTP